MDDVHISCPFCRDETVVAGDPESGLALEFNGDEGPYSFSMEIPA